MAPALLRNPIVWLSLAAPVLAVLIALLDLPVEARVLIYLGAMAILVGLIGAYTAVEVARIGVKSTQITLETSVAIATATLEQGERVEQLLERIADALAPVDDD